MTREMMLYNTDPFNLFQKLFDFSEESFNQSNKYPPHDIYITNFESPTEESKLIFEFALAGFKKDEITIEMQKDSILKVSGKQSVINSSWNKSIRKGIAKRTFEVRYAIPNECSKEPNASFEDGILTIVFDIEKKSPKMISIN